MADIDEIKSLFAETQKTAEAARVKAEEIGAKAADYIDRETFQKIKDDLAAGMKAADAKSAEMAELKSRLTAMENAANRPAAARDGSATPEEKAFGEYLRKGSDGMDTKAMATNSAQDGGYLVPNVMRDGIQARYRRTSPIESLVSRVSFVGGSYDVLVERGDSGFAWGGETVAPDETATPTVNKISITLHELSAMPKVSSRILENASFDLESWLIGRVADRMGRARASAFIAGDGVNRPKGFLAYSKATTADATRATETLQYRATGTDGDFSATPSSADVLVRTFYDLQAPYQGNASWMAQNTVMADIAVMKDGNGSYLLREMLNSDGSIVRTIQGRPAYIADDMPAKASASFSIAVGDFTQGYTVIENPTISILRDPFSAKPNVMFFALQRVGGGVTDFDAIKLIKFAAS